MEHLKQYFTLAHWSELFKSFWEALFTWKFWKELVMMTVGMTFGAIAVYYFLMPSHLIVGSISGLSIVLNTLFGGTTDHDRHFRLLGNKHQRLPLVDGVHPHRQ